MFKPSVVVLIYGLNIYNHPKPFHKEKRKRKRATKRDRMSKMKESVRAHNPVRRGLVTSGRMRGYIRVRM